MRRFHICNPLVVGILWLFTSSSVLGGAQTLAAAAGEAGTAEERWYVLELGGERAGWLVERWWSEGERRVTESETAFRLARGEAVLEIALAGRFVETAAGEPVSLWTRRSLGSEPIETTYRFLPGRVEAETVQAGRVRRETVDPPAGDWLTPARAREAEGRHYRAGVASYRVRAIDPLEGLEPVTVTRTLLSEAPLTPGAVSRWREELSSAQTTARGAAVPVPSVAEVGAEGELLWSRTEILGLEAILRRADRGAALAGADADAPEILLATLVRPDRPIPEPERTRRAVYELSVAGEDGAPAELHDLAEGGAQRVERRKGRVRVTVTVPEGGAGPGRAARLPPADRDGGSGLEPFLAASTYLDHDAPEVRRLLARLRPEDADPGPAPAGEGAAGLARSLTDLVRRHVALKDLGTGFATASEVARTRSGDCTEHAVLLAALLRAAGIPSRVVTGLVYLEEPAGLGEEARGAFGYHMWAQALVDGGWLDLDATLPWGFDATHIALGASPLAGPEGGREIDALVALVGRLRIRVLDVER